VKDYKPSLLIFTGDTAANEPGFDLVEADRSFLAGWGIRYPTKEETSSYQGTREWEGIVREVDHAEGIVRISIEEATPTAESRDVSKLTGLVAHFTNAIRSTAQTIKEAHMEGDALILTTRDDLLVGRAHLTSIDSATLVTDALFEFAPVYKGAYLTDSKFTQFFPIREAAQAAVYLETSLPEGHPFEVGENAWIANVGPGDRMRIPRVVWREGF
jgi:hypothetical protein